MIGAHPRGALRARLPTGSSGSAPSRRARPARRRGAARRPRPPRSGRSRGSRAGRASRRAARSPRRSRGRRARAVGERDALELDREAAARALGDVAGVGGEPVGDVEHRVRDRARAGAPPRRGAAGAREPPVAKGGAARAPSGPVTTSRSPGRAPAAAGDALRPAERGHAEAEPVGARRVAAANRTPASFSPSYSSSTSSTARLRRGAERDDQRERVARRRRRGR